VKKRLKKCKPYTSPKSV